MSNTTNILYHGTSMFYMNDIKMNGLNGKYPQELYEKIKKYWADHKIKYVYEQSKALTYVPGFITRQEKKDGSVELSFTARYDVALEYAGGERVLGEGPGYFANNLSAFVRNLKDTKQPIDKDMLDFSEKLERAIKYPGIVLAIKQDDFKLEYKENDTNLKESFKNYFIKDKINSGKWEYPIRFEIPPDKIYIALSESKLIPLLSKEADEYIATSESKLIALLSKKAKEADEYIAQLDVWQISKSVNKIYNYYRLVRGTDMISVIYDAYKNEWFGVQIVLDNIDIDMVVEKSLDGVGYNTIIRKNIGMDLFNINEEAKQKLHEAIKIISESIAEDKRHMIIPIVLKFFNLKEREIADHHSTIKYNIIGGSSKYYNKYIKYKMKYHKLKNKKD